MTWKKKFQEQVDEAGGRAWAPRVWRYEAMVVCGGAFNNPMSSALQRATATIAV